MADTSGPLGQPGGDGLDPNGPQSGRLERADGPSLAYVRRQAGPGQPTVMFCGGFRSNMTGIKATYLEDLCGRQGYGFLRFDYGGHGGSDGRFEDGTIGVWLADAVVALDQLTQGTVILVGSSMGAWIATLIALQRPARIAGLVLLAPAIDFTEDIIWDRLDGAHRAKLGRERRLTFPSAYSEEPDVITWALIEEGRRHLILGKPITTGRPVRVLHGMHDSDIPWAHAIRLMESLVDTDAQLTLIKDGEHRLQRPQDLGLIGRAVCDLADRALSGHQPAPPAATEQGHQDQAEQAEDAGHQQQP